MLWRTAVKIRLGPATVVVPRAWAWLPCAQCSLDLFQATSRRASDGWTPTVFLCIFRGPALSVVCCCHSSGCMWRVAARVAALSLALYGRGGGVGGTPLRKLWAYSTGWSQHQGFLRLCHSDFKRLKVSQKRDTFVLLKCGFRPVLASGKIYAVHKNAEMEWLNGTRLECRYQWELQFIVGTWYGSV